MTPPPSPDQTTGGPSADTPDTPDSPAPKADDTSAQDQAAAAALAESTGDAAFTADPVAPADAAASEDAAEAKQAGAEGDRADAATVWVTPAGTTQTPPSSTPPPSLTKVGDPDDGATAGTAASDADLDADLAADDEDLDDGDLDDTEMTEEVIAGGPQDTVIPLVGAILGLVALAALLLTGLVLPLVNNDPHHVPVGIVGNSEFQTQLKDALNQTNRDSFEFTTFSNLAALQKGIEDRSVYGGFSLDQSAATAIVSSASSVEVANLIAQAASAVGFQSISDGKALPTQDRFGQAFIAAGLPLALAGILPALVLILVFRRRPLTQFIGTIATAFLTAAGAAAILTLWLDTLAGSNYWLVTVALFAGLLTSGLIVVGLNAIGGRITAAVGAGFLVLISYPLSGLSTAPELLPPPLGDIGQFLPVGAGSTLLRNAAFFDGHAVGKPLAVLGVWALLGLLALLLSETMSEDMFRTGPDEAELKAELAASKN